MEQNLSMLGEQGQLKRARAALFCAAGRSPALGASPEY